ncbi:MAG TPA: EF-hand domain-containing protein [Pirellulales bacterium]|nr:EF-hand domain-containing protein [Pirellulales bacterium]
MSNLARWTTVAVLTSMISFMTDPAMISAADKTKKPAQGTAAKDDAGKSKAVRDNAAKDVADRQDEFADLADDAAATKAGKAKAAADKRAAVKAKKADAARRKKEDRAAKAAKAQADADAEEKLLQQQMQQMQNMSQQNMRGRRGGGLSNNQGMYMLMRQFDANGNGQLDPQELQAMKLGMAQMQAGGPNLVMAQQLQRFDTNGNGQLDPSEQAAMQRVLTQGMNGGMAGGGVQVPGAALPKNQ